MSRPFYLDGVKLEMVRSYKYLGFVITPSGEINTGLKDLRDRAFKAFMKIKNDMGPTFNYDIPITLKLLDCLVKPILLYASDFWGCLKLPKNDPIENLHMRMYKQILGVKTQTTNIGVLLELGRVPLTLWAKKFAVKNWERIRLGSGNEVLLEAYNKGTSSWDSSIRSLLEHNGMLSLYLEDSVCPHPFIFKKLFQRLEDNFHETSFGDINKDSSKLRTYAYFKTEPGFESYLEMKNISVRQQVTKFRLSAHRLAIETGRYIGLHEEDRRCEFCPGRVEDEVHFLFECTLLRHLRQRFLEPLISQIRGFEFFPRELKMKALLSEMEYDTCKFISDGSELRSFLMSKPKSIG